MAEGEVCLLARFRYHLGMSFFRWRKLRKPELDPDEIFLDASNLPSFDTQQFEGRIEKPIARKTIYGTALVFLVIISAFALRVGFLEVVNGQAYANRSLSNSLRLTPIFPERGLIYDRNQILLAWNDQGREYLKQEGFGHFLGYLGYPTKNDLVKYNDYDPKEYIGKAGVEKTLNQTLLGTKGEKVEEVNALGNVVSDHIVKNPENGKSVYLSIDSRIQEQLYSYIKSLAQDKGFTGGAAGIMDVKTGEVISLVSYPDYDSNVLTKGDDQATIKKYLTDPSNILLDRAVAGLYTPGSIFKLYLALGALTEKIISPDKIIVSTGSISLPNPYNPKLKSVFNDWKALGPVDMRKAIALSSDVYFYEVGGGYGDQPGLGIDRIDKYAQMFGLGEKTGISLPGEKKGVLPTPAWKADNFNGEKWLIGDTYHTAIGQYGVLVNTVQILRSTAAIANGGKLLKPTVLKINPNQTVVERTIPIAPENFQIVKEGMRDDTLEGTALALNVPYVQVAAKTGTAELGITKNNVNSWVTGFFPYDKPRYSFVVVMEKGPRTNLIGGVYIMRNLFDWMHQNLPQYFTEATSTLL